MSGHLENRTRLPIPFDAFPDVPKCVAGIVPPWGLAIRCPRVAHYFCAVVETHDESVKKRYVVCARMAACRGGVSYGLACRI